MKYFLIITFTVISISAFGQSESGDVSQCFEQFKKAVAEGNGKEASEIVAPETIEHYQSLLNLALEGDSIEVASLRLIDKLVVISMRNQLSKEDILQMDGKNFIAYAVDHGMLSKNSLINFQLGEIRVTDEFTIAQIIVGEMETPLKIHFYDQGGWRLDITPVLPEMSTSLKKTIDIAGMSEEEFILMTVQSFSGRSIGENIWFPMK
ncbi:hypothetical protein [Fulvivirga kasyanovii]